MKYLFPFLFLTLFLLTCGPKLETVEVQNEAGQITARYTHDPESKLKQGKHYLYAADETPLEEADYKDGLLDGERKVFHENGAVQAIETYKEGQFEGQFQSFYESGQLELIGKYSNNEMSGIWIRYYETGEKMEEVTFKGNEENGPFTEYYKNGQLKAQGAYLNGDNEHGELKMFDESGTLVRKMQCEMGRCETTWEEEEVAGEKRI